MKISAAIYLFVIISFSACDNADKDSGKKSQKDGLIKQYRADGSLKTEVEMKNGKKNGVARSYYKDGTIRQEVGYVNNVKHGTAITYYESGQKYQVTPYENGKIHGIRKKYRMDGKLMAEVPYHYGVVCSGLKEYLLNGQPKKKYPKIVIQEVDDLLRSNEFVLRISMSDGSKNVTYYLGTLDKNGCIAEDAMRIEPQKPGVLELTYSLGPGMFMMETINIIAVVKTRLGNSYVTKTDYNLAIENRI